MWNSENAQSELQERLASPELPNIERIRTLNALAYIHRRNYEACHGFLDEAESLLAQESGDLRKERADHLYVRSFLVAILLGERHIGTNLLREVLQLYREIGDARGEIETLLDLARDATYFENYADARQYVEECKELSERHPFPLSVQGKLLYEFANTYQKLQLLDFAEGYALQTLELGRQLPDLYFQVGGLSLLGLIETDRKRHDKALDYAQQCLSVVKDTNVTNWILFSLCRVGFCYRQLGQPEQAIAALGAIATMEITSPNNPSYADCCVELGRIYLDAQQFSDAEKWINIALEIFEQSKRYKEKSLCLKSLSALHQQMGNYQQALECLQQYDELRTTAWREKHQSEIAHLAAKYEFELRQKEVELYRFQNVLLSEKHMLLQRAFEEQQELVNIVAHDLQTPVTAIMLTTSILDGYISKGDISRMHDRLERIRKAVKFMSEVINQLRTMSKVDGGFEDVDLKPVVVNDILTMVIERNQEIAQQKQIDIQVETTEPLSVPLSAPLSVIADPVILQQIFENLLSNCLKYSYPHTSVKLSIRAEGANACIQFTDQGIGIEPEEAHKLFTKFGRLSSRPTAAEPSTGLGLYITRKQVEAINGTIAAHSAGRGKGSTFVVTLPIHTDTDPNSNE